MKLAPLFSFFILISSILFAQNSPLDKGLIAYYNFDHNVNEQKQTPLNGTIHGNVKFVNGIRGKALFFQGDMKEYILIKNFPYLENKFTFSVWVKPKNLKFPRVNPIFNLGKTEEPYCLFINYKALTLYLENSRSFLEPVSFNFQDDEFYHIVASYNGKQVKYYINGKHIGSKSYNLSLRKNQEGLFIGSSFPGGQEYYRGQIDELRIYNRALKDCEILHLYHDVLASSQELLKNIDSEFNTWQKKDMYESTKDHQERIRLKSELKKKEIKTKLLNELVETTPSKCPLINYNADNQFFKIKYPGKESFELFIPKNKAPQIGQRIPHFQFKNPVFNLGKRMIKVEKATLVDQQSGESYRVGYTENMNLSKESIEVTNQNISVSFWDKKKVDGDVISIFFNDQPIKEKLVLAKQKVTFNLTLKKGINRLRVYAIDEGRIKTNTYSIEVNENENSSSIIKDFKSNQKGDFKELVIIYK